MDTFRAIRAGKTLLCSLSLLLALAVICPAQELDRRVGAPIDVSVGAGVHPEVNADVTPADPAGGTHHASSFTPTRNQAATWKPSSVAATSDASTSASHPVPPKQLGPAPMTPPFTPRPSSKLSLRATPAANTQKKHLALASPGGEATHSRLGSTASMSGLSELNPSVSSARLPHRRSKPHAASTSPLTARNRQTLGGISKGVTHSSAKLPKQAPAK